MTPRPEVARIQRLMARNGVTLAELQRAAALRRIEELMREHGLTAEDLQEQPPAAPADDLLQPSPAQPSPAQPSPAQRRLRLRGSRAAPAGRTTGGISCRLVPGSRAAS